MNNNNEGVTLSFTTVLIITRFKLQFLQFTIAPSKIRSITTMTTPTTATSAALRLRSVIFNNLLSSTSQALRHSTTKKMILQNMTVPLSYFTRHSTVFQATHSAQPSTAKKKSRSIFWTWDSPDLPRIRLLLGSTGVHGHAVIDCI